MDATAAFVPAAKLPELATADLIAQYDLAAYTVRGGMPSYAMRRQRLETIVDLLTERAESGDTEADRWILEA